MTSDSNHEELEDERMSTAPVLPKLVGQRRQAARGSRGSPGGRHSGRGGHAGSRVRMLRRGLSSRDPADSTSRLRRPPPRDVRPVA